MFDALFSQKNMNTIFDSMDIVYDCMSSQSWYVLGKEEDNYIQIKKT